MPVLRPLVHADLDALLVVQREGAIAGLGHIFPQEANPFPVERIRERWAREIDDPGIDCFAIVHDGRVAGFAATRGAELLHFGTAPDTWGTGLAGEAHDALVQHLGDQGHVVASLRVFEENQRAVRFYVRRGWRDTGVTSRTTFAPFPVLRQYELTLAEGQRY